MLNKIVRTNRFLVTDLPAPKRSYSSAPRNAAQHKICISRRPVLVGRGGATTVGVVQTAAGAVSSFDDDEYYYYTGVERPFGMYTSWSV